MNLESTTSELPHAVRSLLGSTEIYARLDAVALREMAKFGEITNVHGLPLHPIALPPDPDGLLESSGMLEDLPTAVYADLRESLRIQPQILLHGAFGGSMTHRFPVAALFPQDQAHLAQAWDALLWRDDASAAVSPDLTVIHLPDFSQPVLLSLPDEGVALILGTDDPRPGLLIALEWANRHWSARNELIKLKKLPPGTEPSVILPGGSFLYHEEAPGADGANGAPVSMVFPGESIPISWEETLRESLPTLGKCDEVDLLLAGAEPWCAEGGGRAAPFWRNMLLPLPLLRSAEGWKAAALDPDALPVGLRVTDDGSIDWEGSDDEAFVVVPRSAAPPPFPREHTPLHPSRHYTHRAMKPEAMDLWAMGFPSPEILGPDGGH